DGEGVFYLFPGGGQNKGETLAEALKRECLEEVGADVDVKELIHIREYIGKNHEHASFDSDVHQIEYYFLSEPILEESEFQLPLQPDGHQIGIEWLEVKELDQFRIYPKTMGSAIQSREKGSTTPVYLGDVN